jgi:hypothetical protein
MAYLAGRLLLLERACFTSVNTPFLTNGCCIAKCLERYQCGLIFSSGLERLPAYTLYAYLSDDDQFLKHK